MRDNFKLKSKCYWYYVDLLGLYSVEALKALSGSVNPPGHPRPKASEQVPKMKKRVELKGTGPDREKERISAVEVVNWSVEIKKWQYQFIVFGIWRQLMKFVYTPRTQEIVHQMLVEIRIEVWSLVPECGRQKGLRD